VPSDQANKTRQAIHRAAPWWLPGGHLQTIWPALKARHLPAPDVAFISYRRERWQTPDDDFIDVDWQESRHEKDDNTPMLVLFHGLEGSSRSHYALAFARYARDHGWRFVVPHFRGCGGEINRAPRAYHSGDFEEIGWVLQRLRRRSHKALMVVGVSLGGNALLRWAQEAGSQATVVASAVASVSAPIDLSASGHAMGVGFNRWVYTRMFLNSMKPKAMQKLAQYPGLFSAQAMLSTRTLFEFDNVFTAPLHGFQNTVDYWKKASASPHLASIRVPTLLLNAQNDPFVPAASLPKAGEVGQYVQLCQPRHGGHVGFAQAPWPGDTHALAETVGHWLAQQSSLTLKDDSHG